MKFRTEIDIPRKKGDEQLRHSDRVLLLGSCFTDEIGRQLDIDGFHTVHNPMGPLFNPASILRAMQLASSTPDVTPNIVTHADGTYHCIDFASRYQHTSLRQLKEMLDADLHTLATACREATVAIITLGSADVFTHRASNTIAGNCHRLPFDDFFRWRLSCQQCTQYLRNILQLLPAARMVIFTVSPIRHLAYGLHGNNLSKARLLLAVEAIAGDPVADSGTTVDYFPAYEILLDDLRDYRFYGPDLKHPSTGAVDYIYEKFAQTYFSPDTKARCADSRAAYLRSQHLAQ